MKKISKILFAFLFLITNFFVSGLEFYILTGYAEVYRKFFIPAWLLNAGLYYFLVMKERKNDKFYFENESRMKYCFLIQLCIILILLGADRIYHAVCPPENPGLGMDIVFDIFFALPLPVMCWLRGWLFRLIIIQIPHKMIQKRL